MSRRSQRRWKNEYGDWKIGWATGAWLGAIVIFVGAITGGAAAIDRGVCLSKLDAMGQPGSWGPMQGCMRPVGRG